LFGSNGGEVCLSKLRLARTFSTRLRRETLSNAKTPLHASASHRLSTRWLFCRVLSSAAAPERDRGGGEGRAGDEVAAEKVVLVVHGTVTLHAKRARSKKMPSPPSVVQFSWNNCLNRVLHNRPMGVRNLNTETRVADGQQAPTTATAKGTHG